jgi:hypothetical protein
LLLLILKVRWGRRRPREGNKLGRRKDDCDGHADHENEIRKDPVGESVAKPRGVSELFKGVRALSVDQDHQDDGDPPQDIE